MSKPNFTVLNAAQKIAFAKAINPEIFENKSPYVHKKILDFTSGSAKRKVVEMFRDGAKSTLLNNIELIERLFFRREDYMWIISDSGRKAQSFLKKIKRIAQRMQSAGWDIRQGETWNKNEAEFIIEGKVCGIACFGSGEDPRGYTSSESGKRPTYIIADDILSREKAKSKEQREKLKEWFWSDIEPALHPQGEILLVGTPLHEEDLLNECIKSGDWAYLIIPIIINGKSAWSDRKTLEWIKKKKQQLFKRGMHKTWYNEYLCVPQGDEDQLFKREMFNYFKKIEYEVSDEYLEMGNAKERKKVHIRKPRYIVKHDGTKIDLDHCVKYTTMDLSTEKGKDKTAIITCAYDSDGNMYVVDISSGYWSPFEKSLMALKAYKEFKAIRFGIEKAGAQNDFFYTMDVATKESGIHVPVEEVSHKGVSKNIRISNLHPMFAAGKVFFCEEDMNTTFLEAEFGAFVIDIEATQDDHIDALAYQMHFIRNRSFKPRRKRARKNMTIGQ
jgi:predicted phage terminase large subunit-like protein